MGFAIEYKNIQYNQIVFTNSKYFSCFALDIYAISLAHMLTNIVNLLSKENIDLNKKTNSDTKVITSVIKALDVLELVARHKDGLTVTEISSALGYGTSATYHLLKTLRLRNYLAQDPDSKKYKLGFQLFLLHPSKSQQDIINSVAYDHMTALTEKYDENCNLLYPVGTEVEYIAQTECKQMLRMFTQIGAKVPFYCTGGGKAIFAFLSEQEQHKLLSGLSFSRFTDNTICTPEELLREVAIIRKDGVSFDREEREVGVFCIAAPIFNGDNVPVAAISMSCPKFRLDDRKLNDMTASICASAREISTIISTFPA